MLLLIFFFLLHGYKENDGLVPMADLLLYGLVVAAIAMLFYFSANRIYKNRFKSGLLITLGLFCYLFYGVIQDSLQQSDFLKNMARDHVLILVLLAVLLTLALWIRFITHLPQKLTLFLNSLLLLCLLADFVVMAVNAATPVREIVLEINEPKSSCDTCSKPDIYLLLLDEYAGTRTLKEKFGFSNHLFVEALRSKGFFVADAPTSNYSYTPFSMACMFNMKYSGWKEMKGDMRAKHYTMAANQLSRSPALHELQRQGYELQNLSIFDIQNKPAAFDQGFMALNLRLVTDKTMWERLRKSLFWQLNRKDGWVKKLGWDGARRIGDGNAEMIKRTIALAMDSNNRPPQFVYTHLLMPHRPYLYDSLGRPGDAGYTSYLQYTNREVQQLVDAIMKGEKGQAVIMVMSDHGLRSESGTSNVRDVNNNFNAVYLPSRNYRFFYDSISNVNQFRALFNSLFVSNYELLKDSVKY